MPPVVDEESYLFIGGAIGDHLGAPYDWWRAWQPLGDTPAEETFVYAHPPLHLWWSAICQNLTGSLASLRIAVALPWLALLAGAVAYLTHELSRRSGWALALWLSSPVVLLGCQASLMIDLPFVALSSVAVALWVKSIRLEGPATLSFLVTGAVLGLACITKYPALVLLPVFVIHAIKSGNLGGFARVLAAFLFVFGGVQVWLLMQYGEFHLWAAVNSVGVIDRGPIFGRGFGLLVRLGVMFTPVLLFMNRGLRAPFFGAIAGVVGLAFVGLGDFGLFGITAILALCAVSGLLISTLISGVSQAKTQGDDDLLLACWAAAVLLSVIFGHNYAGGRYLLPAALPLAILLSNTGLFSGVSLMWKRLAVGGWGVVGLLLAVGVDREARAIVSLADMTSEHGASGDLLFSGEWTFRHAMVENGWTWLGPNGQLQVGDLVALPSNAGAGLVPAAELVLVERLVSPEMFPFRLIDYRSDLGYHSELLGRLPFGFSTGEWHVVELYRVEGLSENDLGVN
jgi:hypothetical protein